MNKELSFLNEVSIKELSEFINSAVGLVFFVEQFIFNQTLYCTKLFNFN